jgi:ABC-type phosphate transport system substrate-binding protein
MNRSVPGVQRAVRRVARAVVVATIGLSAVLASSAASPAPTADARQSYQRISGEGSSWAANAIDAMRRNVEQFGITVDYSPSGSTAGRKAWLNGTVDFAASDIPFQFTPEDGSAPEQPAAGSYAYIPVTAGGTAFMYNLKINGKQVTNLRLSGENVSRIFTNDLTTWNDPALQADNPGIVLPARPIVPVVRSDGSGSSAQFTQWMIDRHPAVWQAYCERSGRAPACGSTSFYPTVSGSATIAQAGDLGVAGYVSQGFAEGAIGYVNYSYALNSAFPVVKVLNAAGFYTEPTPENVAVSLLKARINTDESNPALYLTQDLSGVYADQDPRSYQLSSYSYFILPTVEKGQFTAEKGRTLSAFAFYAMCEAQQQSESLGYSPLPINLVEASLDQIRKIPGAEVPNVDITKCNNPTFAADGTNTLANNAPQPLACDAIDVVMCPNGTGGLANVATEVTGGVVIIGGGGGGGGGTGGGGTGGGSTTTGGTGTGTTSGTGTTGTGGTGTTSGTGGAGTTGTGSTGVSTGTGTGGTTGASGTGTTAGTGGTGTTGTGTTNGDQLAEGQGTGGAIVNDGGRTVCDAETADCSGATVQQGDQTASNGQATSPIVANTLAEDGGWGAKQFFVVLVILLMLGVVFGPAIAWRHFARPEPA